MNLFLKIIIIYSLFLSPLFSQFGKNKVQYEQFDWSFIKTEHFDIYYYNEGKEQAGPLRKRLLVKGYSGH